MMLIPLRHLARAVVRDLAKLEAKAPSDAVIEAAVARGIAEGMRRAGLGQPGLADSIPPSGARTAADSATRATR